LGDTSFSSARDLLHQLETANIHAEATFAQYYSDRDWRKYRPILAEFVRYGLPGKILDVGCGIGFFIECATRFGLDAEGIEASAYAVEQCRQKGLTVHLRLISEGFPYPDGSLAGVVMNQVIEHIPRPIAQLALRETFRVLMPEGILIIKSPCKYDRTQSREQSHINLYAPSELVQEVKKVGFTIVNSINKGQDLGLGKVGSLLATALYRLSRLDCIAASANCLARKLDSHSHN